LLLLFAKSETICFLGCGAQLFENGGRPWQTGRGGHRRPADGGHIAGGRQQWWWRSGAPCGTAGGGCRGGAGEVGPDADRVPIINMNPLIMPNMMMIRIAMSMIALLVPIVPTLAIVVPFGAGSYASLTRS